MMQVKEFPQTKYKNKRRSTFFFIFLSVTVLAEQGLGKSLNPSESVQPLLIYSTLKTIKALWPDVYGLRKPEADTTVLKTTLRFTRDLPLKQWWLSLIVHSPKAVRYS